MNEQQRKALLETVAMLNDMVRSKGGHTAESEGAVLAAFAVLRRNDRFPALVAEFAKVDGLTGNVLIDAISDMAETEITLEMSRQMFNIDRADVISAAIGMLKVLP